MGKKLRKYRFKGLPKISREHALLQNAMLKYLPYSSFEHGFKDVLRQRFEPLLKTDVDVWFENIENHRSISLRNIFLNPLCVAQIALFPKTEKIFFEFDLPLAQQLIDRMLGGDASDIDPLRPLSEIEEGLFSFLLLQLLNILESSIGEESQLAFRLEKILHKTDLSQSIFNVTSLSRSEDEEADEQQRELGYSILSYKLFFDVHVGFCRVFIPNTLLLEVSQLEQHQSGPAMSRYLNRIKQKSERVGLKPCQMRVILGKIHFSPDDLMNLDVGDIVLLEEARVQLDDEQCTGEVSVMIEKGEAGYIDGSLTLGDMGRYEVILNTIHHQPIAGQRRHRSDMMLRAESLSEENTENLNLGEFMNINFSKSHQQMNILLSRESSEYSTLGDTSVREASYEQKMSEFSEDEYEEEYEEEAEEEEPLQESVGLLEDVAVSMSIELGRVSVSAADIVGLRPGQVIELSKAPSEPVDLVIEDRLVGQGELVEIEGELGVRILSLRH